MKRLRITNPDTIIRIGLLCLVAGLVFLHYVHPSADIGSGPVDGTAGLFMGVAIGAMLWGVWQKSRIIRGEGARRCE